MTLEYVKKIKGAADRNGDFNGTCEQVFMVTVLMACSHSATTTHNHSRKWKVTLVFMEIAHMVG